MVCDRCTMPCGAAGRLGRGKVFVISTLRLGEAFSLVHAWCSFARGVVGKRLWCKRMAGFRCPKRGRFCTYVVKVW